MLARLVVHLQANYSSLTSGLQTARNQTAVAAQSITKAVGGIADGSATLSDLETRANETATAFDAVAASATVVEHAVAGAAFTAELAAGAFTRASTTAATVGAGLGVLDRASLVATGSLSTVSTAASHAAPMLGGVAKSAATAGNVLRTTAQGARSVSNGFAMAAGASRTVAGGVSHVAHAMHASFIVSNLFTSALTVLLIPLRAIGVFGAWSFGILLSLLGALLIPLQLLWSGLTLAASAIWSVVAPIASLGVSILKVWFTLRGWVGAWKMILDALHLLPPKLRLVAGGLLALGMAGKAGGVVVSELSGGLRLLAGSARIASAGFRLLYLPIQAIRNPLAAIRSAATLAGGALWFAGSVARRTAGMFWSAAGAIAGVGRSLASMAASGISSAIGGINRLGGSLATMTVKAAALAAIGGVLWGAKLAAAAETSQIVFGTMLKDMSAGHALLSQMENWKGGALFDPKAVQDSGRFLLKAGVAAGGIVEKLDQLGNIAVATKTPIEDLSRIYQQGMVKGRFQTDLVNQLAERGIDIYHALEKATGKSGVALAEMISAGKIGPKEMNAALEHLTTGQGIYAGALANVAQTTEGLWATMSSKVGFAIRAIGGIVLQAFNFKGLLASGAEFADRAKSWFISITPVVMQLGATTQAAFLAAWAVVSAVFTAISGTTGATMSDVLELIVTALAMAEFGFLNWQSVAELVFLQVELRFWQFVGVIGHFFETLLPHYLTFFSDNFGSIFFDAFNYVTTILINLGETIRSFFTELWEFLSSGGTDAMETAWRPLTEGFVSTMKQMEPVPARVMSATEAALQSQIDAIGGGLQAGMQDHVAAALAELDTFNAAAASAVPDVQLSVDKPAESAVDGGSATDKAKAVENKAVMVRSEEGQKVLADLLRRGVQGDKKTTEQLAKDSRDILADIRRNTENAPKLRARKFGGGA